MRRQKQRQAGRQRQVVSLAAGGIVLVLAMLVGAKLLTSAGPSGAEEGAAPPGVVAQLSSVPARTFDQVGRGGSALLTPVRAPVQVGPGGRPLVSYVGAEYCPFCAAERWPLIVALSRFGSFTGLRLSHSAADDVYPSTPTFSFVGSSYSSTYVEFSAVELQSNVRSGNTYRLLQTPTPNQDALMRTYDVPPYVPAASAGAIPFLDIANQFVLAGASYDVGLLRGLSQSQIAAMLSDGTTDQARAIVGGANVLSAAVCRSTGDQPPDVCTAPAVKSLEATLAAAQPPANTP